MADSGSRNLYFLEEAIIRPKLTEFYLTISKSTENARSMSSKDPWNIEPSAYEGTDMVRQCMRRVCHWLETVKDFCVDEEVFREQILDPMRITAKCLVSMRSLKKHTTTVSGWVFEKSEPYVDPNYGTRRITLSMVVPMLQTVFSIRMKEEEADRITNATYEFDEVEPIPLVNRLYFVHPRYRESGKKPSLVDWNFLKIGFGDHGVFKNSLELENFCEIQSSQHLGRHHLGAPFIIGGKMTSFREPTITIRSMIDDQSITFNMSDDLHKNLSLDKLELMEGKFVRVMAIQWYDPTGDSNGTKRPEVVFVEPESDLSRIVEDDMVGYVRMRTSVSLQDLAQRYQHVDPANISAFEISSGFVKFVHQDVPTDDVVTEYLKAKSFLRDVRSAIKSDSLIQVSQHEVIDQTKVSIKGLAFLITKDGLLSEIINFVLRTKDESGMWPMQEEILKYFDADRETIGKKIRWLRYLNMLEKNGSQVACTKIAYDVAEIISSDEIGKVVASLGTDIVSIREISNSIIIPSLLERFLDTNSSGFIPATINKRKNRLYWIRNSADTDDVVRRAEEDFRLSSGRMLSVMRKINFPFTTMKVLEEMQKNGIPTSFFVADRTMKELAAIGKLLRSGESWEYPLRERIIDFLRYNSNAFFSSSEIIRDNSIPLADQEKVHKILNELKAGGAISMIGGDTWTLSENLQDKIKRRIVSGTQAAISAILKSRRNGIDEQVLFGMAERYVYEKCQGGPPIDRRKIVSEILSEMIKSGKVIFAEGFYKTPA
ncbi:MAG: hypothetical protein QXE84_07715 [Candidatus Nitrosotenuis sp.]